MSTISLRSVTKKWGHSFGLKSLDLDIKEGEFLILLGPSGCGKTTTMRIIAGLETATDGTVYINNEDITDRLPRDRNMAMVFQNYALYPHMTVAENIAYPLRVQKIPQTERQVRVMEAAKRVDLETFLDRRPKQLSGGQRQRVALARALVRNPAVFLMDEPLSNLDAKLRVAMRAQIKHLQRELGVTMIYVTHDQIEAMTLADRVVVMNSGEVQQIGTPDAIYDDPENLFVAGFVGSPPMNFIAGAINSGCFTSDCCKMDISGFDTNKDVVLAFRAEDTLMSQDGSGHINGTIYGVEPTGESTLLVVQAGSDLINIRVAKDVRPAVGVQVAITIKLNKYYLFDAKTQQRIRTG